MQAHYQVRRWLADRPRPRAAFIWSAYVSGGLASLFALDGRWALFSVSAVIALVAGWLGAVWFGAHTPDGYFMQLRRTWENWATEVEFATRRYRNRRDKLIADFEQVAPPPVWREEQDRIAASLQQVQAGDGSDPGQWRERVRALHELGAIADAVAARRSDPDAAPYLTRLADLRRGLGQALAENDEATRSAGRRAEAKLARMWRPPQAERQHDALRALLHGYSSLLHDLHRAALAGDASAAEAAAGQIPALRSDIEEAWDATAQAVDLEDRWSMPEQPSASS